MPDPTQESGGLPVPDVPLEARRTMGLAASGAVPASVRWASWLVGGAVCAIVFTPYVTLGVKHSTALTVQAVLILLVTTILAAAALSRRGWSGRVRSAPHAVKLGLAAYSGAALLGALVGLAHGNDLSFLAGQLLSMGLLPLAAVAGLAFGRAPLWRAFAAALVGSVAVAACVNLTCLALGIGAGPNSNRLFLGANLGNNVAPTAAALITLNLALAVVIWEDRLVRWASALAIVVTSILVVGSGIRSLWLVAAPSLVAVALLSRAVRRLASGRCLVRAALGAAVVAVALTGSWVLLRSPSNSTDGLTAKVRSEVALLAGRVAYLIPGGPGKTFMDDPSVAFRALETEVLLRAFVDATPLTKLLGRGLGFTYQSKDVGMDEDGLPAVGHATNYVHNFYLFLPVKLGAVGGIAVLAAFLLWIAWSVRSARTCGTEPQRTFLIAVAAIWIAAAVWNVACPEFIDFRVAPLWGLLIAASVNAAGESD